METENARSYHSSVVVRIFRKDLHMGTGFLVRPDLILTCFHVIDRNTNEPLRVGLPGGDFQDGVVENQSEAHDLALIRVPRQEASTPVCFLKGLETRYEKALCRLVWNAVGYDLRDSSLSIVSVCPELAFQCDDRTGTLLEVQIDCGLPSGFSGGPVLIEIRGRTFCIGISTLGGEDRAKSRIRLADCIVGFLEESSLEVDSQGANGVLAKEIPPTLARRQANSQQREKQGRSWRWIVAISLLAAASFAGWYLFLKLMPDATPPIKDLVKPNQERISGTTALPFYEVKIMLYSSSTTPQMYIDHKPRALDGYDGRTATLRLHRGSYQVEADYSDRICTTNISVTRNLTTEAECHLR